MTNPFAPHLRDPCGGEDFPRWILVIRELIDAAHERVLRLGSKRQQDCAAIGIPGRRVHDTRHTFISLARRDGARKDVLERITHDSAGDIVDRYTTFDWAPLCEAVTCLRLSLTE